MEGEVHRFLRAWERGTIDAPSERDDERGQTGKADSSPLLPTSRDLVPNGLALRGPFYPKGEWFGMEPTSGIPAGPRDSQFLHDAQKLIYAIIGWTGEIETWRGFPLRMEISNYPTLAEFERNSAAIFAQAYVGYIALGYQEAADICFGSYRTALSWAEYYERFPR